MKVDEQVWRFMQQHLGYSDEEMVLFRSNPKNEDIISKGWIQTRGASTGSAVLMWACAAGAGDGLFLR